LQYYGQWPEFMLQAHRARPGSSSFIYLVGTSMIQ